MSKKSKKPTFGEIFNASEGRLIESDKEYDEEEGSPREQRWSYD